MKRRGRSPTEKSYATNAVHGGDDDDVDDDDVDDLIMMDTEDQENLVQALQEQAQEQVQRFQKAFVVVGVLAIMISLVVYPLLCLEECSQRRWSCGTHALVSSLSHGLAIYGSQRHSSLKSLHNNNDVPLVVPVSILKTTPFLLGTILTVVPVIFWVGGAFHLDVEHFHLGLVVGNLLTLLGSFLLVWDAQSTQQALDELYGAKYEHKSL